MNRTLTTLKIKSFLIITALTFSSSIIFAQLSATDFVFTVKTDNNGASNNTSYRINTDSSFPYSFDVDWENDGIFDDNQVSGSISHNYQQAGTYTIRIRGQFPSLKFGSKNGNLTISNSDHLKLLSVDQWGDQLWRNISYGFYGCENLTTLPIDTPNFSQIVEAISLFENCYAFNSNINHWDVSTILNMNGMFKDARVFNQPLNAWDVSSVQNMGRLFYNAMDFNQALDNWDVSNVTYMGGMFMTDNRPAYYSSFNQPLNNWNVSSVQNFSDMFHGARLFNQPLNSWDVSSAINFGWMFTNAVKFNQPLDNWDVSRVKRMTWMFGFASEFNQPLNSWAVDSVTAFDGMFVGTRDFNQPLDNWNTAAAYYFAYTFNFTDSFNQSLTNWDFSNAQVMIGFLQGASAFSTQNYDSLLMHWNTNYSNKSLSVGVQGLEYCNGANARSNLMANGWSFTGDALGSNCIPVGIDEENASKLRIHAYPNPANEYLLIEHSKEKNQHLELYNLTGSLIKTQLLTEVLTLLNVADIQNGVYVLKIGTIQQKIVIKH